MYILIASSTAFKSRGSVGLSHSVKVSADGESPGLSLYLDNIVLGNGLFRNLFDVWLRCYKTTIV
jgi:hypothetical protein